MVYAEKAMYEAFRRTKLFFFKPFEFKKWLKLSLVGLLGGVLQQAGGGCGSSGSNYSGYSGGNSGSSSGGSSSSGGG
jgi:hypothetical protein